MLARFNILTTYNQSPDKDVRNKASDAANTPARVEFVLRYFAGSTWFMPFASAEQVKQICDEELLKTPTYNFFYYVRAFFETDQKLKLEYLLAAAKCEEPYKAISAQAAYEAAKLLYPEKETGAHSPTFAWFSRALILGSPEAKNEFLADNICGKGTVCPTALGVIYLTTYLANKKIAGLAGSTMLKNKVSYDSGQFTLAYDYPMDDRAWHCQDSPLRKILEMTIAKQPLGFVSHFCYCKKHNIISEDAFKKLMQFYFTSGYTDQDDRRQKAIDIITKKRLLSLISQPASATSVPAPLPSAPLQTNVGSYYTMYSAIPSMMPTTPQFYTMPMQPVEQFFAQQTTQQESLAPVYIASSSAASSISTSEPSQSSTVVPYRY